jgi:Tfp pilus assembly protein PilO
MPTERLIATIKEHGRICAGVLLLAAALVVRSWIITPHLASLRAAQQYERATGDRIDKSKMLNRQLRAAKTRLEKLAAEHVLLSDMAFRPDAADEFLSNLAASCEQSGCSVVSLNFANGQNQKREDIDQFVVARGVTLAVQGQYDNISRLIEILQARPQKVWVDKLQMEQSPPDPSLIVCRMTITIYIDVHEESVGYDHDPIHQ